MKAALVLIVMLAGCATATSEDTSNLPLCIELGCEDALCSSAGFNSRCTCRAQTCVFAPSCASLGCDADHPPTCETRLSCSCEVQDNVGERCEKGDSTP